jgi:hypothetical protein
VAWAQNTRPVRRSATTNGSTVFQKPVGCSTAGVVSAHVAPSSEERAIEFSLWAGE